MKIKLSLRTKIFILIFFSVTLMSIPVITISYEHLKNISRQFEEKSFGNMMYLIEDNINFRYLNLISTEIMLVLERKNHLRTMAHIARTAWKDLDRFDAEKKEEIFSRWGHSLYNLKTFSALFVKGMLKTGSPYPKVLMQDVNRVDYKGIPLANMINSKTLANEGTFAVFTLSDADYKQLEMYEHCDLNNYSLLLYFLPLDADHVIMFGSGLADIKQNEQISEQSIIDSMQEKFDSLVLYPNSVVALFSGSSLLFASKGQIRADNIRDIPQYMLDHAKQTKMAQFYYQDDEIPENSYFKAWGDSVIRLSYFKALDWYVMAAVPLSAIEGHSEQIIYRLILFVSIVVIVCVFSGLLLAYKIINPLQLLIKKVLELAQADFKNFNKQEITNQSSEQKFFTTYFQDLPINRTDEVGQLASAFSKMASALEQNIENLLKTQATTQRIQGELNAARDIQMGILRKLDSAPQTLNFHVAAFLDPAKEVGGDFYDFFALPNDKKVVVIGDVAGKGVAAALFMSMTVTLIRYAMLNGLNPAKTIQQINDVFSENNPRCMFVTLFIGLLDEKTGELEFTNGGHCFPYIINKEKQEIRQIESINGPLVGVIEGANYSLGKVQLKNNDICLLYTDGVTEAMDKDGLFYGDQRLKEVLLMNCEHELTTLLQDIYNDLLVFRKDTEQSDDITMLAFSWKE